MPPRMRKTDYAEIAKRPGASLAFCVDGAGSHVGILLDALQVPRRTVAYFASQMPGLVEFGGLAVLVENAVENNRGFGLVANSPHVAQLGEQPHHLGTVIGGVLGALLT
mgnify:CR=1 FL=1